MDLFFNVFDLNEPRTECDEQTKKSDGLICSLILICDLNEPNKEFDTLICCLMFISASHLNQPKNLMH
jgi:hypothetical protein